MFRNRGGWVATVRQGRSKMMVTLIREAKYICIWKSFGRFDWQLSVMSVIRDTRMQPRCDSRADFRPACASFPFPRLIEWSILFFQFLDDTTSFHYHSSISFFSSPKGKLARKKILLNPQYSIHFDRWRAYLYYTHSWIIDLRDN